MVDGRPSNPNVFKSLVGLFSPDVAIEEIVSRPAICKWADIQTHGPSRTHGRLIASHSIVNGRVGLQVILSQSNHLAFNHQFAHLNVVRTWRIVQIGRRFGPIINVQNRVGWHRGLNPVLNRDLRNVLQRIFLSIRRRSSNDAERNNDNFFHESTDLAPKVTRKKGSTKRLSVVREGCKNRFASADFLIESYMNF